MVLSDLQERALQDVSNWFHSCRGCLTMRTADYYVLYGIAGSGKSTLVTYLQEMLDITKVVTITYTGMAACVLMRKGNDQSSTIHRLIYDTKVMTNKKTKKKAFVTDLKEKGTIGDLELIIVDECPMVPDDMIKDILSFGIPVLFLGDPEQLPPIFGDNTLKCNFFLDEPHRQALDSPILLLANYARTKQFDKIRLGTYGEHVRVFSRLDFEEDSIFKADQIICGKNATVKSLNAFYRKSFLGYSDKLIRDHEKIMCLANNWNIDNQGGFSLVNGLIGYASNISIKIKSQIYELDFKPEFTKEFSKIDIDKCLFEGMDELPMEVELFRLPLSDSINTLNEFAYAYAITTHKSQGSEFPYVTFFPEVLDRKNYYRLLYTGITRAKEDLDIIF